MQKQTNSAIPIHPRLVPSLGCLLLCILLPPNSAAAFSAVTLDVGYGFDHSRLLRLNYAIDDNQLIPADYGWSWAQYWEGNFSYWYLYKNKRGEEELFEVGLTPNFRLQRDASWRVGRPYLELGVGVHLLSRVHIATRNLGSAFQFGSHFGVGLHFGDQEQWQLAWRIEHLSNAGLKEPNPGINFSMIRFGYRW